MGLASPSQTFTTPPRTLIKPHFLDELSSLAATISSPWMIIGDFNMTRALSDKNKGSFNHREASQFNEVINRLGLIEIALVDRAYTWSNKRGYPTLVRLDRCLVNLDWDGSFSEHVLGFPYPDVFRSRPSLALGIDLYS